MPCKHPYGVVAWRAWATEPIVKLATGCDDPRVVVAREIGDIPTSHIGNLPSMMRRNVVNPSILRPRIRPPRPTIEAEVRHSDGGRLGHGRQNEHGQAGQQQRELSSDGCCLHVIVFSFHIDFVQPCRLAVVVPLLRGTDVSSLHDSGFSLVFVVVL